MIHEARVDQPLLISETAAWSPGAATLFHHAVTLLHHVEAVFLTLAIERDERSVKMSLVIDGIVQKLYFDKDSYDVLLALIPEKEKTI